MLSVVQFPRQWEEKLKGKPRVLPSWQPKAEINENSTGIVESDIHPLPSERGEKVVLVDFQFSELCEITQLRNFFEIGKTAKMFSTAR